MHLKWILDVYENCLGQKINYNKYAIFLSPNIDHSLREEIMNDLHINLVAFNEKYMGFPTVVGRNKNSSFKAIKERVWKKIQGSRRF